MAVNQRFDEIVLDENLQNDFRAIFEAFVENRASMQQNVSKTMKLHR